jgi:hypothetical protein
MQHRAIETKYKGYNFRSRLEARWAVFFDSAGIKWQYEPEGFEKSIDGEDTVRYLPDFYLPDFGTWVEVKGVWSQEDAVKMCHLLDYGSPLWNFDDSFYRLDYAKRKELGLVKDVRGVLLLGQIPDVFGPTYFPLIVHSKGLMLQWVQFLPFPNLASKDVIDLARCVNGIKPRIFELFCDVYGSSEAEKLEFFSTGSISVKAVLANPVTQKAFEAARSARFNFGGQHG